MSAAPTPMVAVLIAALPPWAAALVWIAAIFGAVLFFYRRFTGAGSSKPALDEPDDASPGTPRPAPPGGLAAPPGDLTAGAGEPPPAAAAPAAFFVDPTADRPGIPLTNPPPSAAENPTGAAPPPSGSGSARAGFFAPSGSGADAAAESRRLTVAEALRGIAMPCGLSPVIDGSTSIPNPFRVAFLTTEADAATVGSSVGDELEHLGYALTTTTVTEVLARKEGIELRVVLYPSPAKATRGLDPVFPAAPPGSVGIEFST